MPTILACDVLGAGMEENIMPKCEAPATEPDGSSCDFDSCSMRMFHTIDRKVVCQNFFANG